MSNALLDKIIKNSPSKYVSVLSESELFGDKDIIPTELPILNVAFSGKLDGGLVSGLTVLAGASKSFKSLMALFCIKAYLDKYDDAVAIIYDSEGGVTPEYLTSIGIDPARVVHIPIEHLEMLKFDMVKTLKSIERADKVIMMIDSIGNTASLKELEDAENEKSVAEMQRAKSMKALFRMVTPSLVAKDVPCIAIAHVYQTMELYSKTIISGGCVEEGTQILLANGELREIQEVKVGDEVLTLIGPKEVTHTWNPDTLMNGTPERVKITLENGTEYIVSEDHLFMQNGEWIPVSDLSIGDEIENIFEDK